MSIANILEYPMPLVGQALPPANPSEVRTGFSALSEVLWPIGRALELRAGARWSRAW
jgi:hypothetical protein